MSKFIEISKGEIILDTHMVCKTGYKVISGCLKSYVISSGGKEHIIQFAPEGWIIADMDSYINGSLSKICIEAVENSKLEVIDKDTFQSFEKMNVDQLAFVNLKLRNNLIATNNRLISLLSSASEERYKEFIETYPQLQQRLPLKLIASYLGMTPEHLSHIRGKIGKKE